MANAVGFKTTKVNTHFTLSSGTFSDEQDLISKINTFLTTTISGWEHIYSISDTGADRNFVYKFDGSRADEHDPGYVGFRGNANTLFINPYAHFDATTGVATNNANDGALSNPGPVSTGSGRWWFIGNNDAFFFVTAPDPVPNTYYMNGAGFWKTYYDYDYDPKPIWGMSQSSATGTFESEQDRVRAFGARSFGKSAIWPDSTLSGTGRDYECVHMTLGNNLQSRSSQPYPFACVFYHSSTTNIHLAEMRGEIPGLFQIALPTSYFTGNVLTISGIGDLSGDYFVHRENNTNTWVLGKITRRI